MQWLILILFRNLQKYFEQAAELGFEAGREPIDAAIKLMEGSESIERARGRAFEMLRGAKGMIERSFQSSSALDSITEMFDSFLPKDMR